MSDSFSHLRFWRRHPKGKSFRSEGTEPITLGGSGSKSRDQVSLCIPRGQGEVSSRDGVISQALSPREGPRWVQG